MIKLFQLLASKIKLKKIENKNQNHTSKSVSGLGDKNGFLFKLSSVEDSDAESSVVEFEMPSDELILSLSEGFLDCQYIMLTVSVSIIF